MSLGLSYLEELPCTNPQDGPRYTCRLCHQTTILTEMVRHLIGRKHRQKYVVSIVTIFRKLQSNLFEFLLCFLKKKNKEALPFVCM